MDRKENHAANGEEFALPILERFEPETTGAEIASNRNRGTAMQKLLFVILGTPARRVQKKAGEKEKKKRERKVDSRRVSGSSPRGALARVHFACRGHCVDRDPPLRASPGLSIRQTPSDTETR